MNTLRKTEPAFLLGLVFLGILALCGLIWAVSKKDNLTVKDEPEAHLRSPVKEASRAMHEKPTAIPHPASPTRALPTPALPTLGKESRSQPITKPQRRDLFGQLRGLKPSMPQVDPSWQEFTETLVHLKTLDAASVDRETGQILLVGERTEEKGPFLLEDVLVACHAAFLEREVVGMTIDEDPKDKRGPWMDVKFFAGTRDTHLGQVMFECDRVMKCLGLGKDNISKEPLTSRVEGFFTQAELSHALNENHSAPMWNRFWINMETGRFDAKNLNGKPLVEVSDDRGTIWFERHQMYVDTEEMKDVGNGKRLASSGGRQTGSAKRFADHFTAKYDDFGKEFPVFGELKQLSKLVLLAEWMRESNAPIDPEIFFQRSSSGTTTAVRTPTLTVKNSWAIPNGVAEISSFGGVSLEPKVQYVKTKRKMANEVAETIQQQRSELRLGRSVSVQDADGVARLVIPFGPHAPRGPPESTAIARADTRKGGPKREADAKISPTSRGAEGRDGEVRSPGREIEAAFGDYKLGVRADAISGRDTVEMPILRILFSARRSRNVNFTFGTKTFAVDVPDRIYVTSPSREIDIRFELQPSFDPVRERPFFKSTSEGVEGYYPDSRSVRLKDGTEFRFDSDGLIQEILGADKPHLRFEHPDYRDGQLAQEERGPTGRPRGPPKRESTAVLQSTSKAASAAGEGAKVRMTVRGEGHSADLLDEGGTYFFVNR